MKKMRILMVLIVIAMSFSFTTTSFAQENHIALLKDGINIVNENANDMTYNIDQGKVLVLKGSQKKSLTFENCIFNISSTTMFINGSGVGYSGETKTRLAIGENIIFNNCIFRVLNGSTVTQSGNDAAIECFGENTRFNNCQIMGTSWQGQFLGLYGHANVTFQNSTLATKGIVGGWSYAMYGSSVITLNHSTMSANGMLVKEGGGNVNAFYSGDLKTNYDAINIYDSTIDFSDNLGGGFAVNRVNIHVDRSQIIVNDNAGNASNSGIWYVKDSSVQMNRNRAHGWSHISDVVDDSAIEILHNGYAGYYITDHSLFTNSKVNMRCNGERHLSYSAGDAWLNGNTVTFKDCPYVWLGAVGKVGTVENDQCKYFVASDLYENKTKNNTESVLHQEKLDGQENHYLFLNPNKDFDYARGDTEGKVGNSHDDDLFQDVEKEIVIGKKTAKIKPLTTAQLSHHQYDWNNGKVIDQPTSSHYGVQKYQCLDACFNQNNWTQVHTHSSDCQGAYVYSPSVGLSFDTNTKDQVKNMPDDQKEIRYKKQVLKPEKIPERKGYRFDGWYTDHRYTTLYDFNTQLTDNWTVLYAKWSPIYSVTIHYIDKETKKTLQSQYILSDINEGSSYDVNDQAFKTIIINDIKYQLDNPDYGLLSSKAIHSNIVIHLYYVKDELSKVVPEVKPIINSTTKKPKTSDNYQLLLPMISLLMAGTGIIILIINKKMKNKKQ